MKKNVLVISSSPRAGGNSDTLCDQLIAGCEEAGHAVQKIALRTSSTAFAGPVMRAESWEAVCRGTTLRLFLTEWSGRT